MVHGLLVSRGRKQISSWELEKDLGTSDDRKVSSFSCGCSRLCLHAGSHRGPGLGMRTPRPGVQSVRRRILGWSATALIFWVAEQGSQRPNIRPSRPRRGHVGNGKGQTPTSHMRRSSVAQGATRCLLCGGSSVCCRSRRRRGLSFACCQCFRRSVSPWEQGSEKLIWVPLPFLHQWLLGSVWVFDKRRSS